ncbi:hypothetical protein BDN72DRAFT_907517 [Pluteus cervinus]|uniref:Uncharacterized protein n=1 Tax=Pluteus cervinus TaxID=181527 RepID=A0ACD2ZWQ8_9AGAR|nr:hypothetical protein BDN72DRAFT_907517 [Pluteus cervinus]
MSRVQKGVYVDGHEREDVVQSRTEFIKYMDSQVFPFCYKFESPPDDAETRDLVKIPPILQPGQKIHYPLCHDEMTMHTNDLSTYVWMKDGQQPL